jgi:YHS domain-containing protein
MLVGCEQPAHKAKATSQAPAAQEARKADPEGLAQLSPADRALAEKQAICPVTGEPLGSMGTPIKLTVAGRTVFICCAGCEEELRKEPEKYFAKLAK